MSSNNGLLIQLYWGGRIVECGGLILYDPPKCNKMILIKHYIRYDDLVDRIYKAMRLDRNNAKISLMLRSHVGANSYTGVPIGDDDDVNNLYYMKATSPHTPCESYIHVEEFTDVLQDVPMMSGGYDTQLTQCEPTHLASTGPLRRNRRTGPTADQPSSSRMVDDIPTYTGYCIDGYEYSTPTATGDQGGVDVDFDSESEPDSSDSSGEDNNHDGSGFGSEPINESGPSFRWPSSDASESMGSLRDNEGVDAMMTFDTMDRGTYVRLNL